MTANEGRATIREMVVGVQAHAEKMWGKGGWDIVAEAMDDFEIAEAVRYCETVEGAIRKMATYARQNDEYRKDIVGA